MTQAEKKREEIRLLSLKVDEIKSQNAAYASQTEELEKKSIDSKIELKELTDTIVALRENIDSLKETEKGLKSSIEKYRGVERELADTVGELGKQRDLLLGEALSLEKRVEKSKALQSELDIQINDGQRLVSTRNATLKAYEDELMIKEALLNKREKNLDLREQGIQVVI